MPEAVNLKRSRSKAPEAPYPGLRPFEPHEWSIFFGREVMTADVIAKLGEQNLILVHGSSGCGKSSLVRAGVLPALQSDHDLHRRDFRYSIIRPSQGPLAALAEALLTQLGPPDPEKPDESWFERLAVDQQLVGTIERRLEELDATFCLIVDQFEEIFRWAEERDRAEADYLVEFISAVATRKSDNRNFFVLVTMRSDYLGQCAQFRDFAPVVNQCQYLLDCLDEFGILRAIHEPADRFGGSVDPALADRLRFVAKDDPDALPVLQHTLMRMYDALPDHAPGWHLDLTALGTVSGEYGPLSEHAEAIYLETIEGAPERAPVIERLFRALTKLDSGGRAIRRPRPHDELVAVCGTDEATLDAIVEAFSRPGRNLLILAQSEHGTREIDISHEALIRRWRRIGDNTIDADTGQRSGWLFREFQDGLIWKALAVFAKRGETTLEPAMTRQWLGFFDEVAGRPAWAARYFVDPVPGLPAEEQPEWTGVMALVASSKARLERDNTAWRRALTRYWSILVGAAILVVVLAAFAWNDLWRKSVEAQEKSVAAQEEARQAREVSRAAGDRDRDSRGLLRKAEADRAAAQLQVTEAQAESNRAREESRRAQAEMREALATAERVSLARELADREHDRQLTQIQRQTEEMQQMMTGFIGLSELANDELSRDFADQKESIRARQPGVALPSDFRAGLRSLLAEMGAPAGRAGAWADEIETLRAEYELTTDRRLAAFVAAAALSTEGFTTFEERFDFDSAEAITARFPEIQPEGATALVHQPRELANRAYPPPDPPDASEGSFMSEILAQANREYGTGNEQPGDGWIYRGRGLIAIRGRSAYKLIGEALDQDFLTNPDLLNDPRYLVRAALEHWKNRGGNERADTSNLLSIARRVAGVNVNRERLYALEERALELIARALERAQASR